MDNSDSNSKETERLASIARCIQSLTHSCYCPDASCRQMSCHKMKRLVQHTKICEARLNGTCPVCKQFIAICCYHAKDCQIENCEVPFCMNIRQKWPEQERSSTEQSNSSNVETSQDPLIGIEIKLENLCLFGDEDVN